MILKRTPRTAPERQLRGLGARFTAPLADGRWLGVGADRLVLITDDAVDLTRPWTDTESASWEGGTRRLVVRWIDGTAPLELQLAEDAALGAVDALRERVTASQVHVEVSATAAGEIRAFVRRDSRGELFSQLIARGPLTAAEKEQAAALERRVRASVGLPEE